MASNAVDADGRTVVSISVAIMMKVPWGQANQAHTMTLRLVTEDGIAVEPEEGKPFSVEGKVEVGRPPGARHGMTFNVPIAMNFTNIPLHPGGYEFEVQIDGSRETAAPFEVLGVPE